MNDLFDNIDNLPQEVKDILNEFLFVDNDYDTCQDLVDKLESVGYTCEYGLDAVPYGLMKINLVD